MRVSNQLHTFPSPNLALTLNCYQLTAVGLGEGKCAFAQMLTLIPIFQLESQTSLILHNTSFP